MDADESPDDVPRDPPTPVDLLLPGAWRSPRPDLRAARRPDDAVPLAPPPPVVRAVPPAGGAVPPAGGAPSTLPLPLGEIDPDAVAAQAASPLVPQHAAQHAPQHAVPSQPPGPAVLPPLPEWSAPPPARPVAGRTVLGAGLGLLVVGGVSLWLGLLPTGGGEPVPGPGPNATAPGPSRASTVVPASQETAAPAASPTSGAAAKASETRRAASQPARSTSRRARTSTSAPPARVVVDPARYVGRPVREVEAALRRLGLRVQVVSLDSRRRAGTVVAVRPSGRVPAGSTVVLVVSR